MPDLKMTEPESMTPVKVTVIGTGDGLSAGTLAKTPASQPNVLIEVVSPLVAIVVRFINLFLTILVGLVAAGMTPAGSATLGAGDFLHLLQTCAWLALPGAGLGALKDAVTIFGKLEQRFPLSTGSV